jgi:hypothetical protein
MKENDNLAPGQMPWKWLSLAMIPLALCYGLLINPYWVPGGDSEVYTAIARSFARGEGFTFNGQPVAIAPPGWPYVLSWLLRISPEFAFLKFCNSAMMLASLGVSFFIIRRFVSDPAAAMCVLVAGVLHPLYPMTFWMHTEALFCLMSMVMLLLAARIAEGKAGVVSILILLALLGANCFVRWTGLIHVVLVLGMLLSRAPGELMQTFYSSLLRKRLVIAVLACVVTAVAFTSTRSITRLSEQQAIEAREAGGGSESADVATESTAPTLGQSNTNRPMWLEYFMRFATAGRWFGWLLWYPSRFGGSVAPIDSLALTMGWLTIGLLVVSLITTVRKLNFFYVGLALYTGALVINWPNPNARYFVPVAPFILMGVWQALGILKKSHASIHVLVVLLPVSVILVLVDFAWLPMRDAFKWVNLDLLANELRPMRVFTCAVIVFWAGYLALYYLHAQLKYRPDPIRVMGSLFIASILVVNLQMLAVDIRVMRSGDAFYEKWEASSVNDLIAISKWLNDTKHQRQGKVGLSETYWNLGRTSNSKFGLRAAHLLSDSIIRPARNRDTRVGRPDLPRLQSWARSNDIDYFLWQDPWLPWRLWHFRLPQSLQDLTKNPMNNATTQPGLPPVNLNRSGGWKLFIRNGATLEEAPTPELQKPWPTRVPGM